MNQYELRWPEHFEDDAWEIESKGWFNGLEINFEGRSLRPMFYDPIRLRQDIAEELSNSGFFRERALIVVKCITRQAIEQVVEELAVRGDLSYLFRQDFR